jgi:hypothetical protein
MNKVIGNADLLERLKAVLFVHFPLESNTGGEWRCNCGYEGKWGWKSDISAHIKHRVSDVTDEWYREQYD